MTAPVFLSFASNDRKAAETICKAVELRGLKCWIATRDIGAGENFQEAITRAIRTAKVMILVFSANANNSLEVKKEIALAGRYNVVVVPVRVEDVVPNDAMSYELAVRQWIDLFDDWENALERLVVQLTAAVQADAPGSPATAPSSEPASPELAHQPAWKPKSRRSLIAVLVGVAAVLAIIVAGLARQFWPERGPSARVAGGSAVQQEQVLPKTNRASDAPAASAPRPLQEVLVARLRTAAPKLDEKNGEEVARLYATAATHKALVISPEAPGHWRVQDSPSQAIAIESALEGCQVFFGQPCVLLASDDTVEPVKADGKLSPRDMPRVRYSGEFSPGQIPSLGPRMRERSDIVNYHSAPAPKAVAFHPARERIFIVTQARNQRAAEEEVLKSCNDDPVRQGNGGPCFLYAVDNRVVLPLRVREPLTPPETTAAALSSLPHPNAPPTALSVASRPPRPTTIPERCAAPGNMPTVRQYCASSMLPALVGDRSGRSTYEVSNLFDNNNTTAWVKARREPGDGWILVDFNNERLVTAITIANGYQKNETVFRENYRVRALKLLSSTGETAVLNVADREGPQRILLEHPIRAEWLQIIIDDLFPGDRNPDVAISELHVISERVP